MVDDHRHDHNEKERESDPRVPLISALFFLCCLTGGILLVLWLADVSFSRPWFPTLAYVFIGFPWIFWSLTYIYTLIKRCFQRNNGGGAAKPAAVATTAKNNRASTPALDSPAKSANGKQVHFGAVIVMDDGSRGGGEIGRTKDGDRDLSVASTQDSETPFVLSLSS